MTYAQQEQSRYAGTPQELFEFLHLGTTYRYTTADVPVTYGGATFTPSGFAREAMRQTDSATESGTLEMTFAPDHPFAAIFMNTYGTTHPMTVTVRARHRSDVGGEFVTVFLGQSAAATLTSTSLKIVFASAQARLTRTIPRLAISRNCPFLLYDSYCGALESAFQWSSTISAISGKTLTIAGLSNHSDDKQFFVGGLIRKANVIRGYIERQAEDEITLLQGTMELKAGDAVTLSAGCDRLQLTCKNRFNNAANFGGHPSLPVRNPFEGRGLRSGATE